MAKSGKAGLMIAAWLCILGAWVQTSSAQNPLDGYVVGDSFGWNVPPNTSFFSDWASSRTFFVGNSLIFESNSNETQNVAEVSTQAELDNCTNPGIVFGTSGVKFNVKLDRAVPRFFLSTVANNCQLGMKFAINVSTGEVEGPSSTPEPPPSNGVGSLTSVGGLVVSVIMTAISFFVFN